MEWKKYPDIKPYRSGAYTISITKPQNENFYSFVYTSWYNAETDEWFKYDPFWDENEILDKIEFKINAWLQLPVYT